MKRVAVTRAQPGADETGARLRALGAEPVIAPLLTIAPCAFDTNVAAADALLFTSINAVRAFPDVRGAQGVPVLAVGDATAAAARGAGFSDVCSADGGVEKLAALAKQILKPGSKLIHISGEHMAGNLAAELEAAGFSVERRIAYAAVAASATPKALLGALDVVLFHSARAAETFAALGAPNAGQLTAACISAQVLEAAARAVWKRIIVSPAPREDVFLAEALKE
jgi:uroporphyrinogen-III synthase